MGKRSMASIIHAMQLLKKLLLASLLFGAVSATYATVWSSAGNMTRFSDSDEEGWAPEEEDQQPPAPPEDSDDSEN